MTGSLLALGVLNTTSSGCCCGAWTEQFWSDKSERQLFFRELRIELLDRSPDDEDARLQQLAFRQRLENAKCPFGTTLPMDVTWPSVPEDIAMMVEPITFLKILAVIYGYLPLLPVAFVLLDSAINRETRANLKMWVLETNGGQMRPSILRRAKTSTKPNEAIVKKLVAEPRPGSMMELRGRNGLLEGSCVETCGMPSSHAAISMGWFTLSILDAISRTDTSRDNFDDTGASRDVLVAEQRKWGDFIRNFCWIPWVEKTDLTVREFISIVLYWCLLLVPVPFMRVVLRDHTESQAFAGCILGMTLAMVWWRVLRVLERRYRMKLRGQPQQATRRPTEVEMGAP